MKLFIKIPFNELASEVGTDIGLGCGGIVRETDSTGEDGLSVGFVVVTDSSF